VYAGHRRSVGGGGNSERIVSSRSGAQCPLRKGHFVGRFAREAKGCPMAAIVEDTTVYRCRTKSERAPEMHSKERNILLG